jgi:hypothetical protein
MSISYPTPRFFTNRVSELTILAQVADDLLAGRSHTSHCLGCGARRRRRAITCAD